MKKILAMVLLATMLMSIASVAGAVNVGAANSFEFSAQCRNTTSYTDEEGAYEKWTDYPAIYVRHWVTGGSAEYTNHFRGRKSPADDDISSRVNCGAKWCTVGLNVPIQSNSIVADWFYSVAGRGNTNHYDYDGVANVTLHGNMYINAE